MIHNITGTVEEQIQIEKEKEEEAVNKHIRELNKAIVRGDYSDTIYGKLLTKLGYELVASKMQEFLDSTTTNKQLTNLKNLLTLLCDDADVIAFVTITECINRSANNQALTQTSLGIIEKLRDVFLVDKLKSDNPKLHTYLGQRFRRASKKQKRMLIRKHIDKLYHLGEQEEDRAMMVRLGTLLIQIVELSGANIVEVRKIHRNKDRIANIVAITPEASDIITNMELSDEIFSTVNKLPMIVPPKDWTNNTNGGFYRGKNLLYTTKSRDVEKHLKKTRNEKIYNVINKLQQTPWRVNVRVLDILQKIFEGNMVDPKSPTKAPYLYGEIPTINAYTWEDFIRQEDYDKWQDFNREREEISIRLQAESSKRLEVMMTLSVATRMKKYKELYYPYMLDYRGRVYCNVTYLTPQGQAYSKPLIELANGRYLDDVGVRWLQIHIANVFGKDKEEYEERLAWFKDNQDIILSVAKEPLDNLAHWVWTDSPYEFLAGCFAWLDHTEGRQVHLAIQLDATCSGIQMYSGLLRDSIGAESVNVIGNKRNDIYQIVADRVNELLRTNQFSQWIEYRDREGKELSVYAEPVGKSMAGKVTRSTVKRNVMTVPYSVTRQGMSNQIWDVIDDAVLKGKEFWVGDKWVANKILTQLNHQAIYEIIDGAKKGQTYLVELSRLLEDSATWTGVLYDFPVRQTSLAMKEKRVQTVYGSLSLNIEIPKLNKRRQANSIAPNFIHNIDSTILLYCIENMAEHIGVIHDCFLIHPNDGDDIQSWYKEGFITVMRADPLRNIQKQLDPEGIVEFPEYGDLDLNEVRNSRYIIS